jgi:uncharacterized protein (DUF952 family)
MSEVIYKICTRAEWESALSAGVYRGSADDLRDGFIHFSRRSQVAGTLQKHFAGRTDLLLVSVEAERLGAALKLEPSRGGELFPHLYGELPTALASAVSPIAETPSG